MITLSKNWHTYVSKGALSDAIKISCTKVVQGGLAFLEGKFPFSSNRRFFCFVQLKFGSKRFFAPPHEKSVCTPKKKCAHPDFSWGGGGQENLWTKVQLYETKNSSIQRKFCRTEENLCLTKEIFGFFGEEIQPFIYEIFFFS